MNKEAKKTLMQIGELVSAEKHDSKQKFMRVKDACEAYHMSRPKIMEESCMRLHLYRLDIRQKTGHSRTDMMRNGYII